MAHSKDPAIKLFGRKIPVPDTQINTPVNHESQDVCGEITKIKTEDPNVESCGELDKPSDLVEGGEEHRNPMHVSGAKGTSKRQEEQAESNSTEQEKVFKKPDKILPCPRCNSLETKFCYFNNYNVNQPRHFCKNCQRYWTAGGTMRNVPIGAGRRKNKHLASQYRQILVCSDGMPPINVMENSDSANHQLISSVEPTTAMRPSTGNGMVLKFGPEAPLCETMESVLNLGDQRRFVEMSSVNSGDKREEPSSCGSSMTVSGVKANELPENIVQKEQVSLTGSLKEPSTQSLHCYPVPPWVLPWSPVASVAANQCSSGQACIPNDNNPNQVHWYPTTVLAVPSFCSPNIPLQFVPAPYWGCMPVFAAGTGIVSMIGSNGCLSPSSFTSNSCCSGNGSPMLGKHSRDSNFMDDDKAEKCILVPKTLRIDDPNEASRSPLWATLGLKPDQKDPISKGSIFRTFEINAEGKIHESDATHILEANPAALSRSHTFQESS